jgi:hypothetical protein
MEPTPSVPFSTGAPTVPTAIPEPVPETRGLAVLSISGPSNRLAERNRLAEDLRQRLYPAGYFLAPGPDARWFDPHYGALRSCSEPLCGWRATLLLGVRFSVVGSWDEDYDGVETSLRMVDHLDGSSRTYSLKGRNLAELEKALGTTVSRMRIDDAEAGEELDGQLSSNPARRDLQVRAEDYKSAKRSAWIYGLTGTAALVEMLFARDSNSTVHDGLQIAIGGAGVVLEALAVHAWYQAVSRGRSLVDAERRFLDSPVVVAPDLTHPHAPGALARVAF